MIHSYSHRCESMLALQFGRGVWNKQARGQDPWNTFSSVEMDHPGKPSHVGSCHVPPNGQDGYDYDNKRSVLSYADNLAGLPRPDRPAAADRQRRVGPHAVRLPGLVALTHPQGARIHPVGVQQLVGLHRQRGRGPPRPTSREGGRVSEGIRRPGERHPRSVGRVEPPRLRGDNRVVKHFILLGIVVLAAAAAGPRTSSGTFPTPAWRTRSGRSTCTRPPGRRACPSSSGSTAAGGRRATSRT